jgi:transposase
MPNFMDAAYYTMDVFKAEQFSSSHIGHLGLVADKIDSLNLIGLIDRRLPIRTPHGAKVSYGERVAAMILNGLGFIDSRLYLFPEFLSDKPLDILFNRPVQAQWFNDDASGRCLDAIAAYGATKLFTELSLTIGQARGLLGKSTHIDTTTLSLYGDYECPEGELINEVDIAAPRPERGYAKSGRHDLKQMVLLLATTGAANFPLWMESHSGNVSDQATMPAAAVKIRQFCQGLTGAPDFIYVGDSAIYANILQHSNELFWISRVPEVVGYQIEYILSLDEVNIARMRERKGRFVLATNQLDEVVLSNEGVLLEYKAQSGVERGFKFIKDDTFQVDSIFLKTPERIEALMMVMALCLMVYGVSEYDLQQSLQEKGETILNQVNKPTDKPSLRWVYFLFRVVNELTVMTGDHTQRLVVNVNFVLRKIIKHFGPRANAIYLNST